MKKQMTAGVSTYSTLSHKPDRKPSPWAHRPSREGIGGARIGKRRAHLRDAKDKANEHDRHDRRGERGSHPIPATASP